jgi:hypothetical protein
LGRKTVILIFALMGIVALTCIFAALGCAFVYWRRKKYMYQEFDGDRSKNDRKQEQNKRLVVYREQLLPTLERLLKSPDLVLANGILKAMANK